MDLHTNHNAASASEIVDVLARFFESPEGAKIENLQACRFCIPGRPEEDNIHIAINPFDTMCLTANLKRHSIPTNQLTQFFSRFFSKRHSRDLKDSGHSNFIANRLMVVSQNETEAIVREIQMVESRSDSIEPNKVEIERSELTGAFNKFLDDIAVRVLAGSSMRGDFWIESLDNGKVMFHFDYAAIPRTKEELVAALAALAASDRANRANS